VPVGLGTGSAEM